MRAGFEASDSLMVGGNLDESSLDGIMAREVTP